MYILNKLDRWCYGCLDLYDWFIRLYCIKIDYLFGYFCLSGFYWCYYWREISYYICMVFLYEVIFDGL